MINSPSKIKENEFANLHRTERFLLPMTNTTFQLLISFLEENNYVVLLRILNTYINIDVSSSRKKKKGSDGATGILGMANQIESFNSQKIGLGLCPLDHKTREQIASAVKQEDEKLESSNTNKLGPFFKKYLPESPLLSPPPKPVPMPPMKTKEIRETIELLRDISYRAPLSSTSLPSICFYTWHNTYDTLTCATFSSDVTLLAGGFSDSVIRVHSLTKENLRALTPSQHLTPEELERFKPEDMSSMREKEGTPYKKLIGHSGTVFQCAFSPDRRFLLSCSEDQTVRLWSMDTFTNLVCYRGHNYPVWDVDIGPEGIYFATASHDRTARLWSCDHIYPLRIFAGHLSDVDTVRFHPNSCYLATGSSDKTVRLWDISGGHCVRVFNGCNGAVQALAFSPDGQKLATAGEDRYIYLWDILSGTKIKRMAGHRGLVTSLSFSGEGSLLASAGVDGTVRIWDILKSEDEDLVSPIDVTTNVTTTNSKKKRKKLTNF
ncbi:Transcription initiation factor TFIID subunit 5 [Coelomomyces lativittatus]|nr:Transcription initiation factor TFIID subunit 5 [Coelomomyces lativittatus]